jgi:hypothetical protein
MQNQTAPKPHGIPESFYSKFGQYVTAVLSGFDRVLKHSLPEGKCLTFVNFVSFCSNSSLRFLL